MSRTGPAVELRALVFLGAALAVLCLFPGSATGQSDRINGPIDESVRVWRTGSQHRLARPKFDAGRVAGEMRMDRMVLVLEPDAAQEQQLDELLAAQQDPTSPRYHQWLTPEEFGRRFGVSDQDLNQ